MALATIVDLFVDNDSWLEGFNQQYIDCYISYALIVDNMDYYTEQANLLNATEIMLGTYGHTAVDPAHYWCIRSGTQ